MALGSSHMFDTRTQMHCNKGASCSSLQAYEREEQSQCLKNIHNLQSSQSNSEFGYEVFDVKRLSVN